MVKNSRKIWIAVVALIVVTTMTFLASQFVMLRKAHSTFDNYYAFRGCVKLIDETPTYGDCQLESGQIIRLINFRNRWYLDGDLPVCWFTICL